MSIKPGELQSSKKRKSKKHFDEPLDEALDETFPASGAVAMLELALGLRQAEQEVDRHGRRDVAQLPLRQPGRSETAMPVWLVKTIWNEDETEATEQWEVNAGTVDEAVREVTTRLRFPPHHVEARLSLLEADEKAGTIDLEPGQVRRIQPR